VCCSVVFGMGPADSGKAAGAKFALMLDVVGKREQSGVMRRLAVVSDYAGLVAVLRARADALNVSNLTLDDVTGLPSGYCGKVLGLKRNRTLGRLSLGLVLQSLGLRLAVLEDPEALARVKPRLEPRKHNGAHRRPASE